jgi:hypothetical protein
VASSTVRISLRVVCAGGDAVETVAKKRRPMSAEARAKLAQNFVKARAARARNLKAAKKATKKSPAKKAKRVAKKR